MQVLEESRKKNLSYLEVEKVFLEHKIHDPQNKMRH